MDLLASITAPDGGLITFTTVSMMLVLSIFFPILITYLLSWSIKGKGRGEDLDIVSGPVHLPAGEGDIDPEEALRDSEAKYRAIVQNVSDLITYIDTNGTVVDVNNMIEEMLGYKREAVLGKNYFSLGLLQMEDIPRITRLFTTVMDRKRRNKPVEMMLIHRNGSLINVEIGTSLIKENGEVKYFVNIIRDITERKRAEEKLAESERRFKDLSTLLPQTVFEVDMAGTLTYANKHALRSFGYSHEDLEEGITTLQLFTLKDRERIFRNMRALMSGKKVFDQEYMALRKDGTQFPSMIYSNPIIKGGKPVGLRGVVIDLTGQKKVETDLIDERKRAELYLDLLSHDIGNLHQGIYSGLQIAEMKVNDPPIHHEALRTSRELVKRSLKLVKNVLLISRLKTHEPSLAPMDLISVINSSVESTYDLFPERNIEININPAVDRVMVNAEPILEELFSNLFHNAVKFQEGAGPRIDVDIEILEDEEAVLVSVSDYGIGIPDKMKPVLFDRFVKSGDHSQTGIGLSLVRELVDRYGGEAAAGDRVPGDYSQGACIDITLPIIKE